MWSGLPSWTRLVEELALELDASGMNAQLVREEAKRGDLLQAASYGFFNLTKQQIGAFIRKACRTDNAEPHAIHRKLVSLGPRCFITTNYDNLIEKSLQKWKSDTPFRTVTNRQLTETAEIIHARALDFVFKPHGDAYDVESIILTREQYRQLLPNGERQAVLESVKMLLASRPILYIGFGLRDPDFLYVKDLLANTYKGGERDHFAIMPDVSEQEKDYWRRNYGVHLLEYATEITDDGTRSHKNLINILDELLERPIKQELSTNQEADDSAFILALTRYSSALSRHNKLEKEFQLRVSSESRKRRTPYYSSETPRYDNLAIEKFLEDGPERSIITGLPGAGKSYSLRRAASRLAEKLSDACIEDTIDFNQTAIPIFADLKLYKGNLRELIEQSLPKSLPLNKIIQNHNTKIFLDSFNEIPREFFESSIYESDFSNFLGSCNAKIIIGSRTSDGLEKLGLDVYRLDTIDQRDVESGLRDLGIEITGRFSSEVIHLLQRPFYFQCIANGTAKLQGEAHPRDFYKSIFDNLSEKFKDRFGSTLDLEESLSLAAYQSLNRGEEAFSLSVLLKTLGASLEAIEETSLKAIDVANWLVSHSILIPYSGGRAAFIHQSVTEYLAAKELARLYTLNRGILREKLALARWDQAIYLTLSLLTEEKSEQFFKDIISADLPLALGSAKYVEFNRDIVVEKLLDTIISLAGKAPGQNYLLDSSISDSLPISIYHEPQLKKIMSFGNVIGGAAAARLLEIKGQSLKQEMLELLFERRSDFNFCSYLSRAITNIAQEDDIKWALNKIDEINKNPTEVDDDEDSDHFNMVVSSILSSTNIESIRTVYNSYLKEKGTVPEHLVSAICGALEDANSNAALELSAELLLAGSQRAIITTYFITRWHDDDEKLSLEHITQKHIDKIIDSINESTSAWGYEWSISLLKTLCENCQRLADYTKTKANTNSTCLNSALLYCSTPEADSHIIDQLEKLLSSPEAFENDQYFYLLPKIDLNWSGRDKVFSDLLQTQSPDFLYEIMGSGVPVRINGLGTISIGSAVNWLEKLASIEESADSFLVDKFASLISRHLSSDDLHEYITEFNSKKSVHRPLLSRHILPYFQDISTDSFGEDSIRYLLESLEKSKLGLAYRDHLLGISATEQFVSERLLPLLTDAPEPLNNNIRTILVQAGKRHGKRYLIG